MTRTEELEQENAALRRENARLRKDKKRLDWVGAYGVKIERLRVQDNIWWRILGRPKTIRAAIDAAIRQQKKGGK